MTPWVRYAYRDRAFSTRFAVCRDRPPRGPSRLRLTTRRGGSQGPRQRRARRAPVRPLRAGREWDGRATSFGGCAASGERHHPACSFREGDEVSAGQVLFEIDPRPYSAVLQQAEGKLLGDLTQAASAAREAARYRQLAATNTVTQEDYEQKQAAADAAAGMVRSDSAAATLARLNLEYATVRAPIGGRTG